MMNVKAEIKSTLISEKYTEYIEKLEKKSNIRKKRRCCKICQILI